MVPAEGFEPPASGLQNRCSTPELRRQPERMRNESPNASPTSVQMAASMLGCQPLTRALSCPVRLACLDSGGHSAARLGLAPGAGVQTKFPRSPAPQDDLFSTLGASP